jgi:uncharacterized iron-regulated protein
MHGQKYIKIVKNYEVLMGFMHMEWEHHILETMTFDSMKSETYKKQ